MSTVGNWRGANIVKDGLVLYLDAGSPNSFYPATAGTTWKDISGNNLTGSLTNGPVYNSSNGGNIMFDGSNDFVNLGTNPLTMVTSSGTLSVWAKVNAYDHQLYWALAGRGGSAGFDTNGYTIWYYNGIGMEASIANRTPVEHLSVSLIFATSASLGYTPHNYTMTWDMTGLSIYLDGAFVASNAYSWGVGDLSSTSFIVGRGPTNYYSSASIYNTLLYNKRLSAAEVLQNYNATKGRFGL